MAWTAPIIYFVGTMVSHTTLNTHLRDNLNELVLHRHSGGSGSGSNALGSLTMVTFIGAAAPAAPGGTLTRVFATGTTVGIRAGAGAARILSNTTHTHAGFKMAWTAPRTWASGEVVTAAALNTDLRDNMNELVLHRHSGGSGSGSNALGSLTSVTFIDAAVPAAPGGTLTRMFSSATLLGWINAGGTFFAATSAHEHSIATGTIVATGEDTSTAGGTSVTVYGSIIGSSTTTILASVFTASGTGSRAVLVVAVLAMHNAVGIGGTGTIELRRDATILVTDSDFNGGGTTNVTRVLSTVELNRPSGSVTYAIVYRSTAGQTSHILGRTIYINEFRQA